MPKSSYSVREAAQEFGVSQDTIRRAIKANRLVAYFPSSKALLFHRDIEEWLRSSPTESVRERSA